MTNDPREPIDPPARDQKQIDREDEAETRRVVEVLWKSAFEL